MSYGQITRWRASDADLLTDAMNERVTALQWAEDDLRRGRAWGGSWSGSHGEQAASHTITALGDQVTDLAAEATAIRRLAAGIASALEALHQDILGAQDLARKYSYAISDTGQLVDLAPGAGPTGDPAQQRRAARINLEQSVAEIVTKARFIEEDAAAGLTAIDGGEVHDGGAGTVGQAVRSQMGVAQPPPPGTDPARVAVWWESLSEDEAAQVMRERGDQIRNLPGVATDVRDQLNRSALTADLSPAREAVAGAQARLDDFLREHRWEERPWLNAGPGAASLRVERDGLLREVAGAERDLEELRRLDDALGTLDSYLIEYDDTRPQLQAVYAVGNPDTAHNVTVTTPGYTTNVHDSIEGMAAEASGLRETARLLDPIASTAAIAFLGYQAPQDVLPNDDFRVLGQGAAHEGARSLSTALQGVQATNSNADLNLSLFGHSYGSTTAGIAAQLVATETGTPVDSLVVYGSPGVPPVDGSGPGRDLASMGLDPSRAYFMENDDDVVSGRIADIGEHTVLGLGNKPATWGMTQLSTDTAQVQFPGGVSEQRFDTHGYNTRMRRLDPGHHDVGVHSSFPKDHTTSQFNLAAIAVGQPEMAVR